MSKLSLLRLILLKLKLLGSMDVMARIKLFVPVRQLSDYMATSECEGGTISPTRTEITGVEC